jgi:shikimate dehydrogenase
MKLALIGKSISHSRSPYLYQQILGHETAYDLIDVDIKQLPLLSELSLKYDGINITSPYKENYIDQVKMEDELVLALGAINTIDLRTAPYLATNTDLLAVRSLLKSYVSRFPQLHLILLGSGVMARVIGLVAKELKISIVSLGRKSHPDVSTLALKPFESTSAQNLVINACSRDFIFQGSLDPNAIFWDLNYHFLPHQNTLPFKVKEYHDGQEMLFLQAKAAVHFWNANNH